MNYIQENTSMVLMERRVLREGEKLDRYRKYRDEPADIESSAGKVIGWANGVWSKDLKLFLTKYVLNPQYFKDNMGTLFVTSKGLSCRPMRRMLQSKKNFDKRNIPRDIPLNDIKMVICGNFNSKLRGAMMSGYVIKLNNGHDINFVCRDGKHIARLDGALDKSQIKVKKSTLKNFTS